MSLNRKPRNDDAITSPSFPQTPSFFGNKSNLKMEIFYVSLMCLIANFLSSIGLELGTRLPLGQTASVIKSAAFPTFFRRTYNLKVKFLFSNLISGCISTTLVVLGRQYNLPYLYLPWLLNTMRGIAFCEGPMLLGIACMILPDSDFPARSFVFITLMLYVEELCLWKKIFSSFRQSWIEYGDKKRNSVTGNFKSDVNDEREKETINKSIKDVGKSSGKYKDSKPSKSFESESTKIRYTARTRFSRKYSTNSTG